jgi:hypothetical protein
VRMLREAPELIATGNFSFAQPRGLFARLRAEAGRFQKPAQVPAPQKRTEDQERRLAEARALVEEALGGE